jgi:hypothetical protein
LQSHAASYLHGSRYPEIYDGIRLLVPEYIARIVDIDGKAIPQQKKRQQSDGKDRALSESINIRQQSLHPHLILPVFIYK